MKCKLCNQSEANQTGSHLFSAFLVESMLGKRGKEIGHLITASPELDYKKNVGAKPIIEDYILCRGCEQRLSYLEGYISQEFTKKIDLQEYNINFPTVTIENFTLTTSLRVNPIAFKLIIYSVLWRSSISNNFLFNHFLLPDVIMEDFRVLLNTALPEYKNHKVKIKRSEWLKSLNESQIAIPNYPFTIIKCVNENGEENKNFTFLHPEFKQPYHLLLNEYLILFFPSSSNVDIEDDFFSLNKQYPTIDKFSINETEPIRLIQMNNLQWKDLINTLNTTLFKQKLESIYSAQTEIFFKKNGRLPEEQEITEIVRRFIKSQK